MSNRKLRVQGVYLKEVFGRASSVVTSIKAIELIEYFSVFEVPEELEEVFQQVHSRVNGSRIEQLTELIKSGVNNENFTPRLSLSFVLTGDVQVKERASGVAEVRYLPQKTLIVDGVLMLFALMTLLGFKHPFSKKRASKRLLVANENIRQILAFQPVQVTLIFNQQVPITTEQSIEIYKIYNNFEVKLKSPLNTSINLSNPINLYVLDVIELIDIEQFGGMSTSSTRVTKNDQFITTEKIMIRLILGALRGADFQDKNKLEGFDCCEKELGGISANQAKPKIARFIKSWLLASHSQFLHDKDGYHRSSQLWQALGLVLHSLMKKGLSNREIAAFGNKLGRLDYSKDASHWKSCEVMSLDATSSYYKIATSGGRSFRVGLAKYLERLL